MPFLRNEFSKIFDDHFNDDVTKIYAATPIYDPIKNSMSKSKLMFDSNLTIF